MLALIGRIASRYVRLRLRGGIYRNPHKASPNLGSVDVRDHEEIRYEEVSKGMKTTSQDTTELHLSTIPLLLARSRRGLGREEFKVQEVFKT